jgi:hypothetical protein
MRAGQMDPRGGEETLEAVRAGRFGLLLCLGVMLLAYLMLGLGWPVALFEIRDG